MALSCVVVDIHGPKLLTVLGICSSGISNYLEVDTTDLSQGDLIKLDYSSFSEVQPFNKNFDKLIDCNLTEDLSLTLVICTNSGEVWS